LAVSIPLLLASVAWCDSPQRNTTESVARPNFLGDVKCPEFVRIPKTTFRMGSPIEDKLSKAYREEEKPQHERTVEAFAMGRFLVTAEEFCLFLNDVGNDGYWIDNRCRS
jgi:formylglycine-generating enzyme required for sulfatase activity